MKNLYSFNHSKGLFGLLFLLMSLGVWGQTTYTQMLSGSGTWTVPCGAQDIIVEAWGAGGGGGNATSGSKGASGGGGGAYSRTEINVLAGDTFPFSVGTGGSGGTGNKNGGDTWFGSTETTYILAKGGKGAQNNVMGGTTYGIGGLASESIGDVTYSGGNGAIGRTQTITIIFPITYYLSGGGGGAGWANGNGENAVFDNGGSSTTPGGSGADGVGGIWIFASSGVNGNNYGGGGSGAVRDGSSNLNGGNGAPGRIRITYTLPAGYQPTISQIQQINSDAGTQIGCDVNETVLTANGGSTGSGVSTLWVKGNVCPSLAFIEEFSSIQLPYNSTNMIVGYPSDGTRVFNSHTSNDPMIDMENVLATSSSFNPEVHKYISIRYKTETGVTNGSETQIYFKKQGMILSESRRVSHPINNDGNWHIMNIDMSQNAEWNNEDGNITGWRYDFASNAGARIRVDYLVLSSVPLYENTANHPSDDHILNYTMQPDEETVTFGAMRIAELSATACGSGEVESTTCTYITLDRRNKTYQGSGNWSDAGNWLPTGLPESHHCVIIPSGTEVVVDNANATAGRIRVANGGKLTISSNSALVLMNEIVNEAGAANFIVENDANLVQLNDVANTGQITVRRTTTPMVRFDATYWSSPVAGQKVKAFSNGTLNNRFYIYNGYNSADTGVSSRFKAIFVNDVNYPLPSPIPTSWYTNPNEVSGGVFVKEEYTFKPGWGYSIRAVNNHPTAPTTWTGSFVGVPHNGNISVPAYGKYTMIGNPYPSAIDINNFFDANPDVANIQLWTHQYSVNDPNYNTGNYTTITQLGGSVPGHDGKLAVGQGFVVENRGAIAEESQTPWYVYFTNNQREVVGGTFTKYLQDERHRFWLSLNDSQGYKTADILLGYMAGATNEFDYQLDGESMGGTLLYSLLDDLELAVQARALPFTRTDVIPLGLVATQTGELSIELTQVDGLFAQGQAIYLKDKYLNRRHNLSASPYSFETREGIFNDRFEIIYTKPLTDTASNAAYAANQLKVQKQNQQILISSSEDIILQVEIFNLAGWSVYKNENVNSRELRIPGTQFGKEIIIVRVLTETGEIATRKFINK